MVECQNNSRREHYEQNTLQYVVENNWFKVLNIVNKIDWNCF